MQNPTCLVLMFKAPHRSKRRLAGEIGGHAVTAAQHLFECALADVRDWQGPSCLAPAATEDMEVVGNLDGAADSYINQGNGNLGERIATVNSRLHDSGYTRQIFIGIDCPALDSDYLARAAARLDEFDVVLGPANDGGVVLMGIRGLWPPLRDLPWSSAALREALISACERAGQRVAMLDAHCDVDRACDLQRLPELLSADNRPSRRRLCEWIESEAFAC